MFKNDSKHVFDSNGASPVLCKPEEEFGSTELREEAYHLQLPAIAIGLPRLPRQHVKTSDFQRLEVILLLPQLAKQFTLQSINRLLPDSRGVDPVSPKPNSREESSRSSNV